MKKISKQKLNTILSHYIDGIQTPSESQLVESLLSEDPSVRRQVEELQRLKALLASKQKLPPDIGFSTRLSVALGEQKKREFGLLTFPKRIVPAVTVLSAFVILLVGFFTVQYQTQVSQFFSDKTQAVRDIYEKDILQSSLLPLFSKVDKDKALQFSLFGTLPLDEKTETAIKVDEQSKKGYRIEFSKDSKRTGHHVTFDKFLAEVKPDAEQKAIIDSLLELTGKRIESSVLIGENNTIAIAPDLPRLNKLMVTNIASCLKPLQRVKLERLLEVNDAPYSVRERDIPVREEITSVPRIRHKPHNNNFVIITPDTAMVSQIQINFDSLRQRMEEDFARIEMRRNKIIQRMMMHQFQHMQRTIAAPPIPGNGELFSIEINTPIEDNEQQQMRVVIQPRLRKHILMQGSQNRPIRIQMLQDSLRPE